MTHKNDLYFNTKLNGKEKFGFRKLSIGLVAVTLGTTFFLSNSQLVHADETTISQQITTENKESSQEDANSNIQQSTEANANNSSKTTDISQSETQPTTPTSSKTNPTNDTQESTFTDQNPDSTSNNKKNEETTTLSTASLEIKDNDSKVAASLSESKITTNQPSYSSTVTATKKSDGTDLTRTTTKNNPATLASNQDTVEIDTTVNLKNVSQVTHDNPITIQIINSNTGSTDPLMTNDRINDSDNWHFEKRTDLDNAFNAWYDGTILPTSVTFRVNVIADNNKVKDYLAKNSDKTGESLPVGVKITYPTGSSDTKTAFYANYVPSQDRIKSNEILNGFQMRTTTVGEESGYGNISDKDKADNNLKDSDTVYQWGLYFNYGNNLNPDNIITLVNAQFSATFHNQIFLPSSIKIFEVPVELVSDGQGNRYGINDSPIAAQGGNIYNYLTTHPTEQKAFEDYLKAHSNSSSFSIDQSKDGAFYVPSNGQNDTTYSKHAYFIQVDAAVKNPENAPVWLDIHSSSGDSSSDHSIIWQNTQGSGSDTQIQQAIIRYYDDDSKQFLNVQSDFNNQAIYANGTTGNWIDFGDEARATFNNYNDQNYIYSRITIGEDADSTNTIVDTNGKAVDFSITGIFPRFDNINNNTDGTDSNPQYFIVHFTHKKQAAESQSTTVTEHVSYYYENGSKQGQTVSNQYAPINQELHFIRDGQTDLVTGITTYDDWKLVDANSNEISLPAISFSQLPQTLDENYKLDASGTFIVTDNTGKGKTEQSLIIKGNNGSIQAIPFSDDDITTLYSQNGGSITVQVPYTQPSVPTPIEPPTNPQKTNISTPPNSTPQTDPSEPVQPSDAPTTPVSPVQPTAPVQPTNASVLPDVTPAQPTKTKKVINHKSSNNVKPHAQNPKQKHGHDYNYIATPKPTTIHFDKSTVQPKNQVKAIIPKRINNKENTLPHTGESKSNLGILGLGFITIANLFGLAINRKRKN